MINEHEKSCAALIKGLRWLSEYGREAFKILQASDYNAEDDNLEEALGWLEELNLN